MSRADGRANDQLRPVSMSTGYSKYAEGSCLIEVGDTVVICTASVLPEVPRFLAGSQRGWVTGEYGMLPRAGSERTPRARTQSSGRTHEIQRLVGRSLRAITDLDALGERTITLDCDVLQADGGTRTAAITGAYLAAAQAGLPVIVDGFIASSAAFVATRINREVGTWWFYAHASAEPGHRFIMNALGAKPLLDLGMRLGEGSGAAVVVPLLRQACVLHNEMATFEQAGVSEKHD